MSSERGRRDPRFAATGWQTALIGAAWIGLCALHWGNDGLWAHDAARHFANGQFWHDFLLSFRLDARDYALSYYARYPVIKPSAYPPVFYLAEAAFFGVLGPSPHLAKALVLVSTLVAALYTAAWIRRWIAPEAGWAAALLVLLPGSVVWSHAVMLHMPALAFATASLYHVRRWLESEPDRPDWWQFGIGSALGGLAVLTYFQAAVVVPVALAWVVVEGRWRLLTSRIALRVLGVAALGLVVGVLAAARWAPSHLSWVVPKAHVVFDPASWTYYPELLSGLFSAHVVGLAVLAGVVGLVSRPWRREARVLLTWCLVVYVLLSCIQAKEDRYILFIGPPLVGLVVVGVGWASEAAARWSSGRVPARPLALGALALLVLVQVGLAARTPVPAVDGFDDVVAFVEEQVPEGAVFYDGFHHGIFVARLQAGDPDYRRRVVVGSKLLYAYAVHLGWRFEEFVGSPEETVERLRRRGGARIVVVERGELSETVDAQRHLRDAVAGPDFELLRSFELESPHSERVDVYALKGPIEEPRTVDLPFPILGPGVAYEIEPVSH